MQLRIPDNWRGARVPLRPGLLLGLAPLALLIPLGAFIAPNPPAEPAVAEFEQPAALGGAAEQVKLGKWYLEVDDIPGSTAEAARWFGRAATQGDPEAQYQLGLLYYRGAGVPRDGARAMRWLELAAQQGHEEAQKLHVNARTGQIWRDLPADQRLVSRRPVYIDEDAAEEAAEAAEEAAEAAAEAAEEAAEAAEEAREEAEDD